MDYTKKPAKQPPIYICKVYFNHMSKDTYMGKFVPLPHLKDDFKECLKTSFLNFLAFQNCPQGGFIIFCIRSDRSTLFFEALVIKGKLKEFNKLG